MVEAERLFVSVKARGDREVSRGLRGVGDAATDAERGVNSFGRALDETGSDAFGLSSAVEGLSRRLESTNDKFSEGSRSAGLLGQALERTERGFFGAANSASRLSRSLRGVNRGADESARSSTVLGRAARRAADSLAAYARNSRAAAFANRLLAREADNAASNLREVGHSAAYANSSGWLYYSHGGKKAYRWTKAVGTASKWWLVPGLIAVGGAAANAGTSLLTMATAGSALAGAMGAVVATGAAAYAQERAVAVRKELGAIQEKIGKLERLKASEQGLTAAQAQQLQQLKAQEQRMKTSTTTSAQLAKMVGALKRGILETAAAIGQQTLPVFKAFINALPAFQKNIIAAFGDLNKLNDATMDFGRFMGRVIPKVIRWLIDLAIKTEPYMRRLVAWLGKRGPTAMAEMTKSFREIYPHIKTFAASLASAVGPIYRIGRTAAKILLPVLTLLVKEITELAKWVDGLPEPFRSTAAAMMTLGLVITRFGKKYVKILANLSKYLRKWKLAAMGSFLAVIAPIAAAKAALIAYEKNIAGFATRVDRLLAVLRSEWTKTFGAFKTVVDLVMSSIRSEWSRSEGSVLASARRILKGINQWLIGGIRRVGAFMRKQLAAFASWWRQHGDEVISTVKWFMGAAAKTVNFGLSRIRRYAAVILPLVGELAGKAFRKLYDAAVWAIAETRKFWRRWGDTIISTTKRAIRFIDGVLISGIRKLAGVIRTIISETDSWQVAVLGLLPVIGRLTGAGAIGSLILGGGKLAGIFKTLSAVVLSATSVLLRAAGGFTKLLRLSNAAGRALGTFLVSGRPLIGFGRRLVSMLATIGGAFGRVKTLLMGLPAVLTRVASLFSVAGLRGALARVVTLIPTLLSLIRGIVPALLGLTGPIGIIVGAIGGLYYAWKKNLFGIRDTINSVFGGIKRALSGDIEFIKRTVLNGVKKVRAWWDKHIPALVASARKTFRGVAQAVGKHVKKVRAWWDANIPPIVASARKTFRKLLRAVTTTINKLRSVWKSNLPLMRKTASRIFDQIAADVGAAVKKVRALWDKHIPPLVAGARKAFRAIAQATGKHTGGMVRWWRKNLPKIIRTVGKAFRKIRKIIIGTMNFLNENAIKPALRSMSRLWRIHGQEMWQEIQETFAVIKKRFRAFVSFLKPLIGAFLKGSSSAWSKWGDEIMAVVKFAYDTIGSVIGAAIDTIATVLLVTMNAIQGDWGEAWNAIAGLTERLAGGILNFIKKWGSGFLSWFDRSFVQPFIGFFEKLYRDIIGNSIIKDLFRDIRSFIAGGGWRMVKNAVTKVVDTVTGIFKDLKRGIIGPNGVVTKLVGGIESAFKNAIDSIRRSFNNLIPSSISIPKVTVGGGSINLPSTTIAGKKIGGGRLNIPSATLGGETINFPRLETGGYVEASGMAMIHEGEQVMTAAEVDRSRDAGGGGHTFNIYAPHADAAEIRHELDSLMRTRGFNDPH